MPPDAEDHLQLEGVVDLNAHAAKSVCGMRAECGIFRVICTSTSVHAQSRRPSLTAWMAACQPASLGLAPKSTVAGLLV